jgi:hypothetical protein
MSLLCACANIVVYSSQVRKPRYSDTHSYKHDSPDHQTPPKKDKEEDFRDVTLKAVRSSGTSLGHHEERRRRSDGSDAGHDNDGIGHFNDGHEDFRTVKLRHASHPHNDHHE